MADSERLLQAEATEAYRRSPYPALIHPLTHPDRLATIARIAGLNAPDIRTARVLEVGVGDGLNTLSMAQTLPDARFVGFDIDPDAIARGQARVARTGLTNVRLEVADLLDGAAAFAEEFDYIIAHGVYAWVPPAVADGLLALIGARLSRNGVAFISFNTLPGGYSRLPLRDAMLRASEFAADDAERLARARTILHAIATAPEDSGPIVAGWRAAAKDMLDRDAEVLIHDELGSCYLPCYLRDLLDRARPMELRFLGDASFEQLGEALLPDGTGAPDDAQALVEARAGAADDLAYRMFRRALLIRADAAPTRRIDPRAIAAMYASSYAREEDDDVFSSGFAKIRCTHPAIAAAIRRLREAVPGSVPVADLGLDDDGLVALAQLYDQGIVVLRTTASCCATGPTDPPVVSPVARAMAAEGAVRVPNLNHLIAAIDDQVRPAMAMLDGSVTLAEARSRIAADGIDPDMVFAGLAGQGLLLR